MRALLFSALLFLASCTPPVLSVDIPSISSMQSKKYEEKLEATALKATLGSGQLEARIVLPDLYVAYIDQIGKDKNMSAEEIAYYRKNAMDSDTITCQVLFQDVVEEVANPSNWSFMVKDDAGNTAKGTLKEASRTQRVPLSSTGQRSYQALGQVVFDGYKLGNAKLLSITFVNKNNRSIELTWKLPADRTVNTPSSTPATTPAAATPSK